MKHKLTLPIISGILYHHHHDDIFLDEKSNALMLEIQKELSVFEPIEDDEARMIWLAIPRGTAEEWKAFDDNRYGRSDDEEDSLASYQEAMEDEFPYEKEWFFLVTSTYREDTFLKISDRDHRYVVFTNRSICDRSYPTDMSWLLEPLLQMVKEQVSDIRKDPDAYNQYVAENLPYRQRSGKIKSKDLNRIIPKHRLKVKNRAYCIQIMKELIRRKAVYESGTTDWGKQNVPAPFDTMSIRTFCKYYRIADTIFWSKSKIKRSKKATGIEDDVEYYTSHGLHSGLDEYDVDSEEDFKRFAKDHYGELGLSRMNVGATDYYVRDKWIISFGYSYSAYAAEGLKIAVALYETGAPFIFYEAENLLHILEETGTVRISPFVFHDYLGSGDDEGVIELPFVEECDKEGELTREQYNEIVRLAKWESEEKLKLDFPVPLEDAVYALIRDEVDNPMTLSEIRHRIEKKYDTYLAVSRKDGYSGYYSMGPLRNETLSAPKDKTYYPTFNEAMRALILNIKMKEK